MTTIRFTVPGRAYPQGSKKAWAFTGKDGKARAAMRESSAKGLKPYRANIVEAARTSMEAWQAQHAPGEPFPIIPFPDDTPVVLTVRYFFSRPKSHYGTGRNKDVLKASSPRRPTSRSTGDLSKLVRAVEDALTDAGMWGDDSQVVGVSAAAYYTTGREYPESTTISVEHA